MQENDNKNIIFTGFMGTGKTTVGKMLAQKLDREFIDTDQLIEERQGLTIPEIFDQLGEAAFRKMEAGTGVVQTGCGWGPLGYFCLYLPSNHWSDLGRLSTHI